MKGFFILLLLFSVYGCRGRHDFVSDLKSLQTRSVILPLDSMQCYNKEDNILDVELLKFVVFSDSIECVSCKLKRMYMWNSLMSKIEKENIPVGFHFIFSPQKEDMSMFEFAIETIPSSGSIYVDTTNIFLRKNPHIPQNPVMHTFLLDENNNVLLVGNPLENKKIEEMFWKIVEERFGKRE